MRTHYDELHVTQDAPRAVVRVAYRVLSQQYHPDRMEHGDGGRRMQAINAAWDVLSDRDSRAEYDQQLKTVFDQNVESYTQHVAQKARSQADHGNDREPLFPPWVWIIGVIVLVILLTPFLSRPVA